ncbi:aminoglycoside phosphotransferase family protein [Microlunatus speluncae]|uniref:aminoglycoside phosphotransferase family protein n=1 Tax=Microlunatus speluncae TaxID=2594267 RepID=UPI0012661FDE|nr:aminoglycoside phosphotransferase family protein [Microlunatus speluncae]
MIEVPASFRAMPRWWHGGAAWLDTLPALVAEQCDHFGVVVDGPVRHGSNALVVPVRRGTERFALRLNPPDDHDLPAQVEALRFWAGRGTVLLHDAELAAGAMLLERLDAGRTLETMPSADAVPILARLMRRLAVEPPTGVTTTTSILRSGVARFRDAWRELRQPFPERLLDGVLDAAGALLAEPGADLAVNGDLHYAQVLGGEREPWLVVDPVLLRGDIEYDLARILWDRLDTRSDRDVVDHVRTVVEIAGLDPARARRWVIFRSADYLFWGLRHGLTEDPPRCHRLLDLMLTTSKGLG